MDLHKLKTFKTVAAFLNFNRAAENLNCAQSTISAQIKSLEDELGVRLFKRVKKRVFLTPAGEKMVRYANRMLSIEQDARSDIKGEKKPLGKITLRVSEAISATLLPPVLNEFITRYPTVSFEISNCSDSSLENELQVETVDLAFMIGDYISASSLDCEKIVTKKLLMVSGPEHPLAQKKSVTTGDLHSQTIFFLKTGCGYGLPFNQMLNTNIIKPASIIEITSLEAIKKCVAGGIGLTILPEVLVQQEIRDKKLSILNWVEEDLQATILMVWLRDKKISGVLHEFMECFRRIKKASD
jgi:DNA-binding transcriptional LysR family regulator